MSGHYTRIASSSLGLLRKPGKKTFVVPYVFPDISNYCETEKMIEYE
jgi:hypothetical protein